ncbi:septum formation initiator family protein [Streptomyces sp. TG1A-8]|uniref:FtsB family cell division protein n=1 Tax=Streptomyces sp. TG1A-8 TaxID=3051385 RepID=UPI00265BCD29|nr:septum formation initiator family protein [Streptomyces sp. TG1A-8]MDO0928118.1 septum formation initiator family protein [Streptomyces sp. TG1A-8]
MRRKPELKGRAARLAGLLPAGRARAARTPFVLLVVLLLGGGLIGLLVLNSALSAGSFELDDLQKRTKTLTDEEQALQRDIDAYSSPDALQRRARELGMVPGGAPAFLGPDGTVKGVPGPAPESAAFTDPAGLQDMIPVPGPDAPAATGPTPTGPAGPSGGPVPSASAPTAPSDPVTAPAPAMAPLAPLQPLQPAPTPTPGR